MAHKVPSLQELVWDELIADILSKNEPFKVAEDALQYRLEQEWPRAMGLYARKKMLERYRDGFARVCVLAQCVAECGDRRPVSTTVDLAQIHHTSRRYEGQLVLPDQGCSYEEWATVYAGQSFNWWDHVFTLNWPTVATIDPRDYKKLQGLLNTKMWRRTSPCNCPVVLCISNLSEYAHIIEKVYFR